MSTRWTAVITSAGLDLLADVQGRVFNFTRAQCGAGYVDVPELENQTAVSDFKKNLGITSISTEENVTKLRLQLSNTSIATSFNLYQIGVFAKLDNDPEDVLFMIIQADTPDYIPSESESPNFVNDYLVNVIVGNADSVSGTIDVSAYVTVGLFQDSFNEVEEVIKSITGKTNWKAIPSINLEAVKNYIDQTHLNTVEEVTVGDGGQFSTINAALNYFSKKYPQQLTGDIKARGIIKLLSGFVMNEYVLVEGINLSWVSIVSEIQEEILAKRTPIPTHMGLFNGRNGAFLPVISALFYMDEDGDSRQQMGVYLVTGSTCLVLGVRPEGATETWKAGIKNAAMEGFRAEGNCRGQLGNADFSGAKRWGIYAIGSSIIECGGVLARNCGNRGVMASRNSFINCYNGDFSDCAGTGIECSGNSTINAELAKADNATNWGLLITTGGRVNFYAGTAINAGTAGVRVEAGYLSAQAANFRNSLGTGIDAQRGSFITAHQANCSNCAGVAVNVSQGSTVNAQSITGTGYGGSGGLRADIGSNVNCYGANFRKTAGVDTATDIVVTNGSIIAANTALGGTSIVPNTITTAGLIIK